MLFACSRWPSLSKNFLRKKKKHKTATRIWYFFWRLNTQRRVCDVFTVQSQLLKSNMCAHAALRECEPWSVCELGVAGCSVAERSGVERGSSWQAHVAFKLSVPSSWSHPNPSRLLSALPTRTSAALTSAPILLCSLLTQNLLDLFYQKQVPLQSWRFIHIFTVYKLKEILHFDFCEVSASFSHSWSPVFSLINGNISRICCFVFFSSFFFCVLLVYLYI